MIKVVAFDVGHTLVNYKHPLSWISLYRPALAHAAEACGFALTAAQEDAAVAVLSKYNTRLYYREYEVTSSVIFAELLSDFPEVDLNAFKSAFYSFFQAGACPFPDALPTLRRLRAAGYRTAALTDVAYGMDDEFSLRDIAELADFLDLALTSVAVGFRKPNAEGYLQICRHFDVVPSELIYVGDEEKDVRGANNCGAVSVLLDRAESAKDFGQRYTIKSLTGLFDGILA